MSQFILEISYLLASILFILGLKRLSHPETARKGSAIAAAGMVLGIIATILFHQNANGEGIGNLGWIITALAVGTMIGIWLSKRAKMTEMPQLVSLFNGFGGASSATIATVEYFTNPTQDSATLAVLLLGLVVGGVSFTGSIVAWGKLDGRIKDWSSNALTLVNGAFLLVLAALVAYGAMDSQGLGGHTLVWILLALSFIYGITFVMPIGGADMPVVISLLNTLTGVAAIFTGFLYSNQMMLTGGVFVGASGLILTLLMCKAMNRSLFNVIVGSFGGGASSKSMGDATIKEISLSDAAVLCGYASQVCIVPGYGLAVAQAQHTCHEFEKQLENRGVNVFYAIHPVAGRMPGHMNVLLAEADVPYPKLLEMDEANDRMANTDVVIVVGANDVVNPAAETDPGSPIFGMPIIQAHNAKNVIVMKRSMGKGYAGIENELFYDPKTRMLFGDAKATLGKLVSEMKTM
jgi:NAD(P) transhydrogenase subunit beta